MRREVLLAIIVGFTIGLIITFGVYTARKALNNRTVTLPQPTPVASPQTTVTTHFITVTQPETETVHSQEKIALTGTTTPNSVVTVFTEEDEILIYADAEGKFSANIELIGGANIIKLVSINPDSNQTAETELTLVYTTATIEP